MTSNILQPVTLKGQHVSLVPLSPEHHDGLVAAVRDGELWKLWYTSAPEPEKMQAEIDRRFALHAAGSMLPFTVLETEPGNTGLGNTDPDIRTAGQPAGMTTYMNIDATNRRLEIGSTWYAKHVQRTALNTEAKLLLLSHAFDTLGCIAVEFRTHFMNQQSRRAIERLGAKLDGILRSHMVSPNGTLRDSCVYSIIAPEWPTVRAHLEWQLQKPR